MESHQLPIRANTVEDPETLLRSQGPSSKPFSELQVDEIAKHLDNIYCESSLLDSFGREFRSKDLEIGQLVYESKSSPVEGPLEDTQSPLEQFTETLQHDANRFVGFDARIIQRMKTSPPCVPVKGVTIKFYPQQLYGAFFLLVTLRDPCRGRILADYMGLGKTTTIYLFIFLNFVLVEIYRDIDEYPDRHCQQGDERCPSGDKWPVVCPCEASGVTKRLNLVPRNGATLLFLPKNLLANWEKEWCKFGLDHSTFGLRLFIQHGSYRSSDRYLKPLHKTSLELVHGPSGQQPSRGPRKSARPHRFIVATTVGSYAEHVLKFFKMHWVWNGVRGYATKDGDFNDNIAWGCVVCDEAHLSVNESTKIYATLRSLRHNGWALPNYIAVTATPELRHGVTDMLPLVREIIAFSPNISSDEKYARWSLPEALDEIDARQTKNEKGKLDKEETERLAQTVAGLRHAFIIQRTDNTVQNKKRLAWIPDLACYDVQCALGLGGQSELALSQVEAVLKSRLTKELKVWINKQKAQGLPRAKRTVLMKHFLDNVPKSRILATVPSLVDIFHDVDNYTWEYIFEQGWHEKANIKKCPLYTKLDKLLAASGKLCMLKYILENLGDDIACEPEKLVVVSDFPVICLCVVVLCHQFNIEYYWMHNMTDPLERAQKTSDFQASRGPAETQPLRVMIGTTGIIGYGITLHKAIRLVLMEPGRHSSVEEQIMKRIHRIGSRSDKCWFYRLINPASRMEHFLVDLQQRQEQFEQLVQQFCREECGELPVLS